MGLGKKTIDDENYAGKRVLVRCDFNVPMKDGQITGWKAFCDFPTSIAVEAIGDYNGDGIDDLRVRNGNDLAAVMVYTDGLEWKGFGSVPSDWKTSLAGPV